MGFKCGECCKNCCYSTPVLTLVVLSSIGVALLGFTLSGLYGIAKMNTLPHIQNGTVALAPAVCGLAVVTLLPLVLVTIMSYCSTGYIRDILFQPTVKGFIGSVFFNTTVLVVLVAYVMVWVLLAIGLGGVMAFYLQTHVFCGHRNLDSFVGVAGCLYYVDIAFNFFPICEEKELETLCSEGRSVGLAYTFCLLFAIFVILGMVVLAITHAYNFVSGRDHIDYRENTRNEYDMKRVH